LTGAVFMLATQLVSALAGAVRLKRARLARFWLPMRVNWPPTKRLFPLTASAKSPLLAVGCGFQASTAPDPVGPSLARCDRLDVPTVVNVPLTNRSVPLRTKLEI